MKTRVLKILMLLVVLLMFAGSFVSCKDKDNDNNSLTGTWRDNYNSQYIFSNNDTLYINFSVGDSVEKWKWTYRFISKDSIQIERLTEQKTNKYTRKTNNKIVFNNSDSILIENFHVSDATVVPPIFVDVKLSRTK